MKKDLKLPWASFGNRESNVNFVLSYGRNHELEDPESREKIVKCVHVLNLAFSVRGGKDNTTIGPGNSLSFDYFENKKKKVLDLLINTSTNANEKAASVSQLMDPRLKRLIEDLNLECISIGIKCIIPSSKDDSAYDRSIRVLNKIARDNLKAELRGCYLQAKLYEKKEHKRG